MIVRSACIFAFQIFNARLLMHQCNDDHCAVALFLQLNQEQEIILQHSVDLEEKHSFVIDNCNVIQMCYID